MNPAIRIQNKRIGKNHPVFIVAEISANHGQDFNRAAAMIKHAKTSGADAVKFQAYTPDTMTIDVPKNNRYFYIRHPEWGGQTLYHLYKKAFTPWSWFKRLKKIADDLGIIFFSTAFDKSAVDLLEELKVPVHKVASFELVDIPLIQYMAKTGKPLILSTGMSTLPEIKEAVTAAKKSGAKDIILLKCVSSYPAKSEEMNLATIPHMRKIFKCEVGLSDHSLGTGASAAAVALGASLVEKHFMLSNRLKTPDSFFSLGPQELKGLVDHIRMTEKALGKVYYGLVNKEKGSRIFRRSLFAVKEIKAGETFSEDNIRSIRPAFGLHPRYLKDVLGKKAKRPIKKGTPLDWDLLEK